MRSLIILLILSSYVSVFGQESDSKVTFINEFGFETSRAFSSGYRSVTRCEDRWCVTEYYLSGKLAMTGSFKDKHLQTPDGKFIYYHRNGEPSSTGNYHEGLKDSSWTYWFQDGSKDFEGSYGGGKQEGRWIYYHRNGHISSAEVYEKDSLIKIKCWMGNGNAASRCLLSVAPEFHGGEEKKDRFIRRNLHCPAKFQGSTPGIEVILTFDVRESGEISHITFEGAPDSQLLDEAIRITKLMPAWTPGYSHNRPYIQRARLAFIFNPE